MPKLKSLSDIQKHLQATINDVLLSEVADAVRDAQQKAIDSEVYNAYSPAEYDRRGYGGGLADTEDNMPARLEGDGVVVISNTTPFNPGYGTANSGAELSGLVEFGHGWNGFYYDYAAGHEPYAVPRPFIQKTREALSESGTHIEALRAGLKKRGLKVL